MKIAKKVITVNVDVVYSEWLQKYSRSREVSFSSIVDELIKDKVSELQEEQAAFDKMREDDQ